MQVDAKDYLELVEQTGDLAFFDVESFNLKGDYGSIICVSIKPYDKAPYTFMIEQVGNDRKVLREAKEALESYKVWATYYGKGFDIKLLNTRLLKWGMPKIEKRHHLDLYFLIRSNLLTSRRSMAHLNSWLETKTQKDSLSADIWVQVMRNEDKARERIVERCESDCINLEELYKATKHFIMDITR